MLPTSRNGTTLGMCLLGLGTSLLLVGIVSGTLLRHLIQITPIVIVFLAYRKRAKWAPVAAIPLFIFWLLIMILIWMFLLGISRIANGHFTPAEIILTVVMALCSIVGVPTSWRHATQVSIPQRIFVWLVFTGLQLVAMWTSFLKPVANR